MEIEFDVQMNTGKIYDYMLRQIFTSFSGIMGEIVGLMLIVGFFLSKNFLYLIAGIIIILYLPVALYLQAKKQALSPAFKEPQHYRLSEEGIEITVLGEHDSAPWEAISKVVSTGKNLILYTNKVRATLFPFEDLGEKKNAVIEMISTHVDPKKVNIRV
ncbi:MAG: YcxB family protein [Lachnospiraceae bacterium]|nr:YcxB family protein [Lachnospiraceae bacterium]